jgi:hypothetical protein
MRPEQEVQRLTLSFNNILFEIIFLHACPKFSSWMGCYEMYIWAELQCNSKWVTREKQNSIWATTVLLQRATVLETLFFSNLRVGRGPSDPPLLTPPMRYI